MKRIESISQIEKIKEGDTLLYASEGEFESYRIAEMNPMEVMAVHHEDESATRVFHPVKLIFDEWWLP